MGKEITPHHRRGSHKGKPEAKGFYPAENYKIAVTSGNKKVFEKTVISEYVRATNEDVKVNFGTLEKENYAVKITAYSPYAKKGQTLKSIETIN